MAPVVIDPRLIQELQDWSDESSCSESSGEGSEESGEEVGQQDDPPDYTPEEIHDEEHNMSVSSTHITGEPLDETALEEVQSDIAGDFERLVGNYKKASANAVGSSRTVPKIFAIEEGEDYNMEDEEPRPDGAPRKKGRKKGHRVGVELSYQVQHMIGEAAAAYVERDLPKALELCQEVIRIEPGAHSAWNTLALVYDDLNEPETSLKFKIMAAHLQNDSDIWSELGRASRDTGRLEQALYCFRKAVSLNPRDVDAVWDRSVVLKETGSIRASLAGFLTILKIVPYHLGVLLQLGPLFSELSEFHRGISMYTSALEFFEQSMPDGPSNTEDPLDFRLLLITLADFCNTIGEHEQSITTIRNGTRWMDGRANQRYWTTVPDDREFDPVGYMRAMSANEVASRPQGFFSLDMNLRQRLAVARLALGDLEEGQLHGRIVLQEDPREYAILFDAVAGAYFEKHLYEQALGAYQQLAAHDETWSLETVMQIAACHRHLEDTDKCIEVLKYIIELAPDNIDSKMRLAEVYEIINKPQDALQLVNQVIALRKAEREQRAKDDGLPPGSEAENDNGLIVQDEKKKTARGKTKLPIETVQALEQGRQRPIDEGFARIAELDPETSDRMEWMKVVADLIDVFRETRELFGGNRFAQFRGSVNERRLRRLASKDTDETASDMVSRLQQDINLPRQERDALNQFRKHTFEEWLALFIRYAFYATRDGAYSVADEVLRHILNSNAFVTFQHQTTIRLALLACAAVQKDYQAVLEHSRQLIFVNQFNNNPLRLYLACLGGGIHTIDAFIDTNFQKFLRRDIEYYKMASDLDRKSDPTWDPSHNRWAFKDKKKNASANADDGSDNSATPSAAKSKGKLSSSSAIVGVNPAPKKATQESPILLALYGQLSSSAKSYQSALFYLYQAYDLQPNDPVVCLSLAVASVARAMQRQSDNRHHMIAQGLAFLERYRTVRDSDEHLAEIEYNFGRAFHQLGLFSLAVKHYERVLNEAHKQDSTSDQGSSPAKEAAYNLMLIYSTTGGTVRARQLARQWLSF
ncbi:transcription factor TFIIIC subunit tfc4 [Tulasnella sp. JGI-2019a]|nr:transcription factor TFIIIC subunit tfc4 [Tulasnella sp. JGI-2019a]